MKLKRFVSVFLSVIFLFLAGSVLLAQAVDQPVILSVTPKKITRGGELTITGNFVGKEKGLKKSTVVVKIDDDSVKFVIKKPGEEIVVPIIPDPDSTSQPNRGQYVRQVVVVVDGNSSNEYPFRQLKVVKPTISSVTPEKITRGDELTITGNFVVNATDPEDSTVEVEIDGKSVGFVVKKPGEEIIVPVMTEPTRFPDKGEYTRKIVVVVNGESSDEYPFHQMTWGAIVRPRVWIPLILYFGLLALIVFRGARTTEGVIGKLTKVLRSETGQLSLSKIQMALWTLVFSLSYVLLSAIYWKFLDITEGMFWLMGISSATAVGAKAIVLKNEIKPDVGYPSKLLSDYDHHSGEYRLSFHRCQIAIWTLIVAVIYVSKVIDTMRLQDIPTQLLVLMGISGGTYLGFNYPKQRAAQPDQPTGAEPPTGGGQPTQPGGAAPQSDQGGNPAP